MLNNSRRNINGDVMANMAASRAAATYFDKIERYELQETLATSSYDYLLSIEETKMPVDLPKGLITNMNLPSDSDKCLILLPVDEEGIDSLELREIHQIVRELVTGIYVLNQTPSIRLDVNYDESTSITLPPAYYDTRVGQILIEVDYLIKSLWHGAYFPKDKRTKFAERWRHLVNFNTHTGLPETKRNIELIWTEAGLLDISKDPCYSKHFEQMHRKSKDDSQEELQVFNKHIDELSMTLTFYQNSVQHYNSMFLIDAKYHVSSGVKSDHVELKYAEKLQKVITKHEKFIEKTLPLKADVCRQLLLLKFVSFLVPFLISLRKRCKIINANKLLPGFTFEECKTERVLPPLAISKTNKCKHFFTLDDSYTHLHGAIYIDRETASVSELPLNIAELYDELCAEALSKFDKIVDAKSPMLERYPLSTITIDGKNYYAVALYLETFYPVSPKQPIWVHARYEEINKLKYKKLPIQDYLIYELFKNRFGTQRTMNLKQHFAGLQAASQRGMVAVVYSLARRLPASRLAMQNNLGLSLIHYAAMCNQPQVITLLVVNGCDVNVRRFDSIQSQQGITPLHLAAKCGSLDSLSCLLAYKADALLFDNQGWCPVHYASYFNHQSCLKYLIQRNRDMLQLRARNGKNETPILLAASSGALDAVKCLIELGASVTDVDSECNNLVHIATLHLHTNILEFFIIEGDKEMSVWMIMVEMLKSGFTLRQRNATKALEILSASNKDYWKNILFANGVPALVSLLVVEQEVIQATAASVLCNIGEIKEVRQAMCEANAIPVLVSLLQSSTPIIHSRAAVLLADVSCVGEADTIVDQTGLRCLMELLKSDVEHVLVNGVNCIRILCESYSAIQENFARMEVALVTLVELLGTSSKRLQANTASALSAIAKGSHENQDRIASIPGALKGLVNLMNSKNALCQVKAANAIESLAQDNTEIQRLLEDRGAVRPLIKLLKVWSIPVKEQGASALWALSGDTLLRQQHIADMIGITILVDMLMLRSEKLQYISGMAIIALSKENFANQSLFVKAGGIPPLVRLLRASSTSHKILLMVVSVLGTLCVGVAHQSHQTIQLEIANADALSTLVHLLRECKDQLLQVEVANTLSKIALHNPKSHVILVKKTRFHISEILHLLSSNDAEVRLKAVTALGTFGFNNTATQFAIRNAGGIPMSFFEEFLDSNDEIRKGHIAFQTVVLARVIKESDPVELSARGIECLVQLLKSEDEAVRILSASLIASLAHTRAGIPNGLVIAGAIKFLFNNLMSRNEQVCRSAAVALGYLSFNASGAREMLVICRNTPGLYNVLEENMGSGRMSMEFVDSWRRALHVGLPSKSLEINGGPPVPRRLASEESLRRPMTTQSLSMFRNEAIRPVKKVTFLRSCASAPAMTRKNNSRPLSQYVRNVHVEKTTILQLRPPLENKVKSGVSGAH